METPDIKIGRSAEWLQDKISNDLEFVFIVVGLFLISAAIYMLKNAVTKGSVRVERLDRTHEENTDALIDATREIKALRRTMAKERKDADYQELS